MQYRVIFPTVIFVLRHNSSRAVFFARRAISNQIKWNCKKNYAIIVYTHDNKTWYFSDCCTNGTSEQDDIVSWETAVVCVFRDGRRSIARCSLTGTKYSLSFPPTAQPKIYCEFLGEVFSRLTTPSFYTSQLVFFSLSRRPYPYIYIYMYGYVIYTLQLVSAKWKPSGNFILCVYIYIYINERVPWHLHKSLDEEIIYCGSSYSNCVQNSHWRLINGGRALWKIARATFSSAKQGKRHRQNFSVAVRPPPFHFRRFPSNLSYIFIQIRFKTVTAR